MLKLHLGCGQNYLSGYTNVDLPSDGQTVMRAKADVYQDIRTLNYAENSVDEIRNHHLLEHFSRAEALRLLFQWRMWLRPGGLLFIETPDFETASEKFFKASLESKFKIARHIFGSQEADWAVHKDWWGEEKFRFMFEKLGFENIKIGKISDMTSKMIPDKLAGIGKIIHGVSDCLDNIVVKAQKAEKNIDEKQVAQEILSMSLIGKEKEIQNVWLRQIFD